MAFIHPKEILSFLNLREGMKVADFGCGAGFFTILMAKAVGADGEVFAIDVQKSSLETISVKARTEGAANIKNVWADLEVFGSTKIAADSLDLVLLSNVLFQSNKKEDILKEARRILALEGKLVVIDWKPESLEVGPKDGYRIHKDSLIKIVEGLEFKLEKEFNAGDYHYGLIFTK